MVMEEVICGRAAVKVILLESVMVSAPLPAVQSPAAVSVFAALIASDKLQSAPTAITVSLFCCSAIKISSVFVALGV